MVGVNVDPSSLVGSGGDSLSIPEVRCSNPVIGKNLY